MSRPSWEEYWMKIALESSTRSTCLRRKVGAVIVRENRLLSMGYNQMPSGITHCEEIGCLRERLNVPSGQRHEICRAVHAEQNAIIIAAKNGASINNSSIFVTASPCLICGKMIINAGINEVLFKEQYPDELTMEMFEEKGVKVKKLKF